MTLLKQSIAAPKLLNVLPVRDENELSKKLKLPGTYDNHGWSKFHFNIHRANIPSRFDALGYDYISVRKPEDYIFEDAVPRPVFFHRYIPDDADLPDWDLETKWPGGVYSESKAFVHSALPVGSVKSVVEHLRVGVWRNPFYWVVLQMLIFSDPSLGAPYEYKITLNLPDGFDDDGRINVFLNGVLVCDLREVFNEILEGFHWVWVNRWGNEVEEENWRDIMSVFKLLYKLDILDRQPDGRAVFSDQFRNQLVESTSDFFRLYKRSRDAREQIRGIIKKEVARKGQGSQLDA